MPGFYKEGEYDVAGFAVGSVKQDRVIDGKDIRGGDVLLGLPSSGVHSNGFSLARKVLEVRKSSTDENPPHLSRWGAKEGIGVGGGSSGIHSNGFLPARKVQEVRKSATKESSPHANIWVAKSVCVWGGVPSVHPEVSG